MVKKLVIIPKIISNPKKQTCICIKYNFKDIPITDIKKSRCFLYDYKITSKFDINKAKLIYSRDNVSIYVQNKKNINNYKLMPQCLIKKKIISYENIFTINLKSLYTIFKRFQPYYL
jgi:hypothetical protein